MSFHKEKLTVGYCEKITERWINTILESMGDQRETFDEFIKRNHHLLKTQEQSLK